MTPPDAAGLPTGRPFAFTVEARDPGSAARAGRLVTGHGEIETPVFMPVGTAGAVKAITLPDLWATGARLILGNTYHLHLRPGHATVEALGGLHRFQGWEGAILTDSAGYQIFSLTALASVSDEGVALRSHLDGSPLYFTPELVMEIQLALGADIMMAFDHCLPYGADPAAVAAAVDRTERWARRCQAAAGGGRVERGGWERVLFGIVQGGVLESERRRAADQMLALDLPGYAIGGLSVGEPVAAMREITELTAGLLPPERPRYLMGVGFPDDLVESVLRGVDMFDCVLPTRMARNGTALTRRGRLVVKNGVWARDERPLDPDCACPVCRRHTRAYLRHLFQSREILGPVLATIHNLCFYQELMAGLRAALRAGTLAAHAAAVTAAWRDGEAERRAEVARARPRGRRG